MSGFARLPSLLKGLGAATLMLATSGCSRPYELRTFTIPDLKEDWGSVFVNVAPQGHWNEDGVDVEGSPYSIIFAPELVERPSPECELHIRHLSITPTSQATPVFKTLRLNLQAGPANPKEPNWRAHSAFFYYVPLSGVYVTSGTIDRLKLPYEPLRVAFYLQGNPSCPAALLRPIRYEVLIDKHPYRGTASLLPSV